ncbi:hypothetical protein M8J76_005544 [Diaphorina citri]|nr:hypothetical protein M8J75_010445 [Diaphorina citri]KAI5744817.1 hypothetical protein M8J76_005544 [Diaphorina citri]KAI5752387.1 hypothetical protein M8J77_016575 [Diaphorina citri]
MLKTKFKVILVYFLCIIISLALARPTDSDPTDPHKNYQGNPTDPVAHHHIHHRRHMRRAMRDAMHDFLDFMGYM